MSTYNEKTMGRGRSEQGGPGNLGPEETDSRRNQRDKVCLRILSGNLERPGHIATKKSAMTRKNKTAGGEKKRKFERAQEAERGT